MKNSGSWNINQVREAFMDKKMGWNLIAFSTAMIQVSQKYHVACKVWNGDDMMGQQIILKNLYVVELNKIQPQCEYLENGF
jgi:hypothetical protein